MVFHKEPDMIGARLGGHIVMPEFRISGSHTSVLPTWRRRCIMTCWMARLHK